MGDRKIFKLKIFSVHTSILTDRRLKLTFQKNVLLSQSDVSLILSIIL